MSSSSKLEVALFDCKSSNHVGIEPEIDAWSIVIMDAVDGRRSLNHGPWISMYGFCVSLHGWGLIVLPDWLLCSVYAALFQASVWTDKHAHTHKIMKQWAFTRWISVNICMMVKSSNSVQFDFIGHLYLYEQMLAKKASANLWQINESVLIYSRKINVINGNWAGGLK